LTAKRNGTRGPGLWLCFSSAAESSASTEFPRVRDRDRPKACRCATSRRCKKSTPNRDRSKGSRPAPAGRKRRHRCCTQSRKVMREQGFRRRTPRSAGRGQIPGLMSASRAPELRSFARSIPSHRIAQEERSAGRVSSGTVGTVAPGATVAYGGTMI